MWVAKGQGYPVGGVSARPWGGEINFFGVKKKAPQGKATGTASARLSPASLYAASLPTRGKEIPATHISTFGKFFALSPAQRRHIGCRERLNPAHGSHGLSLGGYVLFLSVNGFIVLLS